MIGSAPGLACATAIGAAPAMMITTAQAARMARVLAAPNARARRSGLSWRRQVRSFGAGVLAGARSLAGAGPLVGGARPPPAAPRAEAQRPELAAPGPFLGRRFTSRRPIPRGRGTARGRRAG